MEKTIQFDGYVSEIEKTTNKVTEINGNCTDDQYPSAKAVYDIAKNSYNDSKFANTFASAIKNTVTGNAIAMKDISPVEHELDISLNKSKNLIPPNIFDGIDFTEKSALADEYLTLTSNGDGTLNVKNEDTNAILTKSNVSAKPFILPAGTYTFSTTYNDFGVVTLKKEDNSSVCTLNKGTTSASFTLTQQTGLLMVFNFTLNSYEGVIKPQIEQGSVATEFETYFDVANVTLKEYGKNLLNYKLVEKTNYSTPTLIENGFRATGKYYCQIKSIPVVKNTIYSLSYITNIIEGSTKSVVLFGNDSTSNKITTFSNGTGGKFNSGDYDTLLIAFYSGSSTSGTVDFTNIQLELGTSTEYEPYIEPITATSNQDGKIGGLKSIYPATTLISSDENAILTCNYNADTKTYIDNKFLELQTAMVSAISTAETDVEEDSDEE